MPIRNDLLKSVSFFLWAIFERFSTFIVNDECKQTLRSMDDFTMLVNSESRNYNLDCFKMFTLKILLKLEISTRSAKLDFEIKLDIWDLILFFGPMCLII